MNPRPTKSRKGFLVETPEKQAPYDIYSVREAWALSFNNCFGIKNEEENTNTFIKINWRILPGHGKERPHPKYYIQQLAEDSCKAWAKTNCVIDVGLVLKK